MANPLDELKNRIDLRNIPFTDRGSRILVMRNDRGLLIRLAERWHKLSRSISAYRQRPPIVEEFEFTNEKGESLPYEIDSRPDKVLFHTSLGIFGLIFADTETIFLQLPESACGVRFLAHMDLGKTDRRGGVLRVTGDVRRNLAYTTNRSMSLNHLDDANSNSQTIKIQFEEGIGGLMINITPRLGFNRYVQKTTQVMERAEKRWLEWFSAIPEVLPEYYPQYLYAWWVMAAGIISTRFYTTREVMTPSKIHYVGVWLWDALFHSLAYRHAQPALACDQLRILLDHQRDDGMLPDAVHDEGTITHLEFPVDADVTKPPLLAWTIWKIYETSGDREFLQETYESTVRWINWWLEKNEEDGDGLCEYTHPYSSGLDDSPLWDTGMPVCSPDLNAYMVLQMNCLAKIAEVIGEPDDVYAWTQRAKVLRKQIDTSLWDESAGLYFAHHNQQIIRIKTPTSFFPLLCGDLPPNRAEQLVQQLFDPKQFWTEFPVPSVAKNEKSFNPDQMWRGPAWVNVNYLLVEGLTLSGFHEEARLLRQKTLKKLMGLPDFYEFYNPLTGMPGTKAAPIFGWSAALFIDLAIQETEAGKSK